MTTSFRISGHGALGVQLMIVVVAMAMLTRICHALVAANTYTATIMNFLKGPILFEFSADKLGGTVEVARISQRNEGLSVQCIGVSTLAVVTAASNPKATITVLDTMKKYVILAKLQDFVSGQAGALTVQLKDCSTPTAKFNIRIYSNASS